jgi:hypothetical protein
MAVQHRMGLLPQRWIGLGPHRDIGTGGRWSHLVLRPAVSVATMFVTACLGAGIGDLAAHVKSPQPAAKAPSQLDYLVLASMADSQHPLSMAAYRPSP